MICVLANVIKVIVFTASTNTLLRVGSTTKSAKFRLGIHSALKYWLKLNNRRKRERKQERGKMGEERERERKREGERESM